MSRKENIYTIEIKIKTDFNVQKGTILSQKDEAKYPPPLNTFIQIGSESSKNKDMKLILSSIFLGGGAIPRVYDMRDDMYIRV